MGAVCNTTATVLQQWSAMHCKVDLLLGHACNLYYADLIKTMTGLLSGCLCPSGLACGTRRVHRNVEMGEYICKREFRNWMPEILWANLLLVSSMYTPAGKWDLSATIQHQRVERGVKNWRANLNCRDNTGVPDEQTLLL